MDHDEYESKHAKSDLKYEKAIHAKHAKRVNEPKKLTLYFSDKKKSSNHKFENSHGRNFSATLNKLNQHKPSHQKTTQKTKQNDKEMEL